MTANGVAFRKSVTQRPDADYVMVQAPDGVLLELFQPQPERLPAGLSDFFAWPPAPPAP